MTDIPAAPPAGVTPDAVPGRPYWTHTDTPFGRLLLVGEGGALVGLHLAGHPRAPEPGPPWEPAGPRLDDARRQLDEYFDGARTRFALVTRPRGTAFQRAVWSALQEIPYGETVTYGDLAARLDQPGSARAVGLANGRNPVSVVIPCHRVIGAGGDLTGYGWGVDRKAWLLDHEQGRARLPV